MTDHDERRAKIKALLSSGRARLTPDEAGVPFHSGRRRVVGLRREEVAELAGISTGYYARMEGGNLAGVTVPVLLAVARALQFDAAERCSLFELARIVGAGARLELPEDDG